jgi:hypothetical protein
MNIHYKNDLHFSEHTVVMVTVDPAGELYSVNNVASCAIFSTNQSLN